MKRKMTAERNHTSCPEPDGATQRSVSSIHDAGDLTLSYGNQAAQRKASSGGLPDTLRAGLENLSGVDLSDVEVHRNSSRPRRLQALAYTEGTDIYVGPGQEKHLPHEGWHAVQQKQGRVRTTGEIAGRPLNDEPGLEAEADAMGERAARQKAPSTRGKGDLASLGHQAVQRMRGPDPEPDLDTAYGEVAQLVVDNDDRAIGRRIRIVNRHSGSFGDLGRIVRVSRYRNYFAVQFDGDPHGELYRVPYRDMDYYDPAPPAPDPRRAAIIDEFTAMAERNVEQLPFLRGDIERLKELPERDLESRGITTSLDEIREGDYIRLRPTNDPTVRSLVIGCGNDPPLDEIIDEGHEHAGAYTVDANIHMRPTVVGLFGYEPVAGAFPAGQFEDITFEGMFALQSPGDLGNVPNLIPDLKTLLADGGRADFPVHSPRKDLKLEKRGSELIVVEPADLAAMELTDALASLAADSSANTPMK